MPALFNPLFFRPIVGSVLLLLLLLIGCTPDGEGPTEKQTIESLQKRARLRPPAAETNFGYIHHVDDLELPSSTPLLITAASGEHLTIEHMGLVISAIELHRCAPTNSRASLLDWLIPSAHAHVPSSATRFGTPWVEDLLASPGNARMIGGIAPPLGTYCELHIILAPADDDVINITALAPEEIDGHTMLIRGTYQATPDAEATPFAWTTSYRGVVELPLIDPQSGESPVSLDSPDRQLLFLLNKELSAQALQTASLTADGPDFEIFFETLLSTFSIYQYR